LECGVFQERVLDRVQLVGFRETFYGFDRFAFSLYTKDETGIDESAVEDDTASPAISVVTSLFGTRKMEFISEDFE
jgi:hypothetical protein